MKKITKVFGVALFAISMMVTVCSNPGDNDGDKSSPAPSEQPANSGNTEETPEDTVTFETLGVEDYAESLAGAVKKGQKSQLIDSDHCTDLIYKNGFVPVEFDENNTYEDGQTYIRYIYKSGSVYDEDLKMNVITGTLYYVPESMESDFDQAIAAYKAAHAE